MRSWTLVALIVFCACKSPEKKAEQARDELASWAANGQALSEEWSLRTAPDPYVKSSIDVAAQSLSSLAKPLASDERAKAALWSVTQVYESFSRAVDSGDRAAADRCTREFAAISHELQLEKSSE